MHQTINIKDQLKCTGFLKHSAAGKGQAVGAN